LTTPRLRISGTIVIDTSSSSPFDTIALGKELAELHLHLIDSPITQTYMHATDYGESTLMVGSDSREAFEKAEPIISTMAGYVFYMGSCRNRQSSPRAHT
jgi:3-hydroxyisobutyrate dehydrogenase-like beta-hydroxyacid dehydrogenase